MANTPADNLPSNQEKYLAQLIENQKEDLKIKAQELELRKQSDDHQYEFAKATLATQERVLQIQGKNDIKKLNNKYIFSGIIVLVVVLFICFALYLNKDQVVMELIRTALYIFTGGAGGYFVGRNSKQNTQEFSEKKTIATSS